MACSCNEPATALSASTPDRGRHVNFAKGMVLGVDDFRQEFAYVIGRNQWLASEAIGFGTLTGLRVSADSAGADGPRLRVASGSALAPGGKLICVPAEQCCVLNRWLARPENAAEVFRLLGATGSPPLLSPPSSPPLSPPFSPTTSPSITSGNLSLYLTLCYADCLTAPVPIPGEPCRSEEDLMAPSRIADDFSLELRSAPPPQLEEDALRDFIAWLRTGVQVVDTASSSPNDENSWAAALRAAVQPWTSALGASPPLSPPASVSSLGDFLFHVSPPAATIGRGELCAFLRVALRIWATELRPIWARTCSQPASMDDDCVLLARVEFPVVWVGGSPTGAWQVGGSPPSILLDERTRPVLASLRLLQEWTLCGCDCGAGAGAAVAASLGGPTPIVLSEQGGFGGTTAPLIRATADLTLDAGHSIVLNDGASTITLPRSALENRGRTYVIKNLAAACKLACDPADQIDGAVGSRSIRKGSSLTVVSDGLSGWYSIAKVD